MRLVVFHYHDRPGGVREVLERGLARLVARLGGVREVVLLLGEQGDGAWAARLEGRLGGVPLRAVVHADLGYRSGEVAGLGKGALGLVREVLSGEEVLVWAHNLSVGRHVGLLRLLPGLCAAAGATLWLHHHDWWWDGRWGRWEDWEKAGVGALEEALAISVPVGPGIRHFCVNRADVAWLQLRAGSAAQWVGNPLPEGEGVLREEVREAAAWLGERSGGKPVWLAPVRALRRKNLAESLLVTRWAGGEACLVTTGGASSAEEERGWCRLGEAARRQGWPLVPGVLARAERAPRVAALMAAAEAVVMTSLQEGFGLPYVEAAALGKPLVGRALPQVEANMAGLGCGLRGLYECLPVGAGRFDAAAEARRKEVGREGWCRRLPKELAVSEGPGPDDFGGLSLDAQLEVLSSGGGLPGAGPQPEVPSWPEEARGDVWVERFFEEAEPQGPAEPLIKEVQRRLGGWWDRPLLWL